MPILQLDEEQISQYHFCVFIKYAFGRGQNKHLVSYAFWQPQFCTFSE